LSFRETEILRRIEEARQNHIDFLEFPSLGGNVRVKVGSVFLPGVMRGEDHAWNT
jgi:heptaprenylglyceryl phosphate synthase